MFVVVGGDVWLLLLLLLLLFGCWSWLLLLLMALFFDFYGYSLPIDLVDGIVIVDDYWLLVIVDWFWSLLVLLMALLNHCYCC